MYPAMGGDKDTVAKNMAMLWVLNLSDGRHSLLDIAERSNLPFAVVRSAAQVLLITVCYSLQIRLRSYSPGLDCGPANSGLDQRPDLSCWLRRLPCAGTTR